MQCNLTVSIFVSSSLFFLEVVVNVFDYFWKPNNLISNFCVNHLLMFYFVCCNNCALKDSNGACWYTCSLATLRVPEMRYWPAKNRKNLELFEMHTCHCPGAQIWFRHKWRKLVTASLSLPCIGWFCCLRCRNEFSGCFSDFRIGVFDCFLTETFAIGFQRWFGHEWIDFAIFVGKWLLSLT